MSKPKSKSGNPTLRVVSSALSADKFPCSGFFAQLARAFCDRAFKDPKQHCEVSIVMNMAVALDCALEQRDEAMVTLRDAKGALEHCLEHHQSDVARSKLRVINAALAKAEPFR